MIPAGVPPTPPKDTKLEIAAHSASQIPPRLQHGIKQLLRYNMILNTMGQILPSSYRNLMNYHVPKVKRNNNRVL